MVLALAMALQSKAMSDFRGQVDNIATHDRRREFNARQPHSGQQLLRDHFMSSDCRRYGRVRLPAARSASVAPGFMSSAENSPSFSR